MVRLHEKKQKEEKTTKNGPKPKRPNYCRRVISEEKLEFGIIRKKEGEENKTYTIHVDDNLVSSTPIFDEKVPWKMNLEISPINNTNLETTPHIKKLPKKKFIIRTTARKLF